MKVVGITSCPSGVAHTYMAAEALKLAGQKLGIEVLIETQGGAGAVSYTHLDVYKRQLM